jgi:hypothetical protein
MKAGKPLWSEPTESAKVLRKDCCSLAAYETNKFRRLSRKLRD